MSVDEDKVNQLGELLSDVSPEAYVSMIDQLAWMSDYRGDYELARSFQRMDMLGTWMNSNDPMVVVRAILKNHAFTLDKPWFILDEDREMILSLTTSELADHLSFEVWAAAEMLLMNPSYVEDFGDDEITEAVKKVTEG